jgi:ribose transport system substrate-binding protein
MRKGVCILTALFLFICLVVCQQKKAAENKKTIVVIPKATSHVFWQSVHAGAIKAARELDVNLIWIGPEREDDRQQQIALVDNQVMNRVDGIVLAPLDAMALRRPVRMAVQKKIPVIIIDSALRESDDVISSFVATDNREGGRIAGRNLARLLQNKGKVVLLRYLEGSASTEAREEGFLEAIRQFPGIEVVSKEQYGGASKASAQQASENLLYRFKDSSGNLTIDGIFCPNASTAYGMLQALQRQRLTQKVIYVGFDAEPMLVEGLRQGEIDGLVVQNPVKMGYLGVKTMVQLLQGEEIPKRIDTGVVFMEKKDLDKPEYQELINPDIEKWLNLK